MAVLHDVRESPAPEAPRERLALDRLANVWGCRHDGAMLGTMRYSFEHRLGLGLELGLMPDDSTPIKTWGGNHKLSPRGIGLRCLITSTVAAVVHVHDGVQASIWKPERRYLEKSNKASIWEAAILMRICKTMSVANQ